ncbi:MAG: NFYB/HAP3 family transcription factor subunit [Candidatus Pacearchaeota archaeon]|nr:NFYB/HAP3 family transcription factor subunit [Candidatus Pacearchaeota archaeon]
MVKKNKKANTLIKKNLLKRLFRQAGIKRISPEAISEIEKFVVKKIETLRDKLKEKITINARKTVKEKDVKEILNETANYPEI